jgi:hypothetical protein
MRAVALAHRVDAASSLHRPAATNSMRAVALAQRVDQMYCIVLLAQECPIWRVRVQVSMCTCCCAHYALPAYFYSTVQWCGWCECTSTALYLWHAETGDRKGRQASAKLLLLLLQRNTTEKNQERKGPEHYCYYCYCCKISNTAAAAALLSCVAFSQCLQVSIRTSGCLRRVTCCCLTCVWTWAVG